MDNTTLLTANNISYLYANQLGIRDVSLELKQGQVLGLLGPNGAGKSSLLRLLAGVIQAQQGSITLSGETLNPCNIRQRKSIGYLSEHPPLYLAMTVDEYLLYAAKLYGFKTKTCSSQLDFAKTRCGLNKFSRRVIKTLSKGIKQRIAIAQSILHQPKLILLDEPGDGLDPSHLKQMRQLIKELAVDHSIVISTHQIEDVKTCCQQLMILNQGKAVYQGELSDLDYSFKTECLFVKFATPPNLEKLNSIAGVDKVEQHDKHKFTIYGQRGHANQGLSQTIMHTALQAGWNLNEIHPQEQSLDLLFDRVIGEN